MGRGPSSKVVTLSRSLRQARSGGETVSQEHNTEPSDAQLLSRIAEHPDDSRQQRALFYQRHVRYLRAVLSRQRPTSGQYEVDDWLQDTFERAFQRAASYRSSTHADPIEERRWSRAWLGRIARNLFVDKLRRQQELPRGEANVATATLTGHSTDDAVGTASQRLARLRIALHELTDREQDVLRTSAMYWSSEHKQQRLPNEVAKELAERWRTNNENIRAIRVRATKKLRAKLQQLETAEARLAAVAQLPHEVEA